MPHIDESRQLRSRADLHALVTAIIDSHAAESETYALEWKSGGDLTSPGGRAVLAKAILGFANRDPEAARRSFGGCAYLVVGAEPGQLTGVAPVDIADLEAGVRAYCGDRPVWRPDYIELEDKTVLVVTVEPPSDGDPIHTVLKTFNPATRDQGPTLERGDILVRRLAATRRATPEDIERLSRRLTKRAGADLNLALRVRPGCVPRRLDLSQAALDAVVGGERRRLLAPLTGIARQLHSPAMAMALAREYRSESDYRDEVEAYLGRLSEHLAERLLARGVLHDVGLLQLEAVNSTDTPFGGVRVEVTLPDDVGACPSKDDVRKAARFPDSPRPWGTPRTASDFYPGSSLSFADLYVASNVFAPDIEVLDDGRSRVTFADVGVRAHGVTPLENLWLGLTNAHTTRLELPWEATSATARKRISGTLTVELHEELLDPSEVIADPPDDD